MSSLKTISDATAELLEAAESRMQVVLSLDGVDFRDADVAEISSTVAQLAAVDVMETFSPERFTARGACSKLGLRPGVAIDISTGFDLSDKSQVEEVKKLVEQERPFLLTGSPPCSSFSRLQYLSVGKTPHHVRVKREALGERLLLVAVGFYREQL